MDILMDSGAFTAFTKGKKIDIDAYAEFCKKHSFFYGYFNLDVIGDAKASYDNWMYLRSKGADTIPIYHVGTDYRYLERYMKEADFIGIGAVARMNRHARSVNFDWVWNRYFLKNGKPIIKVHGLGTTSPSLMDRYPWYSVDSTSWNKEPSYHSLWLPRLKEDGSWDYSDGIVTAISPNVRDRVSFELDFPQCLQDRYHELFAQYGLVLGEYIPPKKKIRREGGTPPLLEGARGGSTEGGVSLRSSLDMRTAWAIIAWYTMRASLRHPIKLFLGGKAGLFLAARKYLSFCPDVMVSYAYHSEAHLQKLKQLYDENPTRPLSGSPEKGIFGNL